MPEQYYPVLLAMGVAIALGVIMLSLSHLLSWLTGNQSGRRVKLSTFESGMPLLDPSHKRISIAFFLVAIDFIVFDGFAYVWLKGGLDFGPAGPARERRPLRLRRSFARPPEALPRPRYILGPCPS